jgi:diguanylate cyclase (GGDEF)-like protein
VSSPTTPHDSLRRANRLTGRVKRQLASERLGRALLTASDANEIGRVAMQAIADALHARIGCLAMRMPGSEQLSIVATLGYPLPLVHYVRVPDAPGVLRTVYETRRALRAADVADVPGVQRARPRYATRSCMARPLLAGSELLGIVCVSDREDKQPFSIDDMMTLRALSVPIALAMSREIARNQIEALAHAAAVDPLSGLFNRRYFQHRLAEELERARRHEMPLALAMIDLDSFKAVNDQFGHLVGDAIIRHAAELLRLSVRVFDVCTRFGGDEFAIVMPGSSYEAAINIAERIRERIAAARFDELNGLQLTASIGVAVASGQLGMRDLIGRADRALYLAKRTGKNSVRTLDADPQ